MNGLLLSLTVSCHARASMWLHSLPFRIRSNANVESRCSCRVLAAMSSLDEIQSMINSAKDELAQSRKMKEQVEHETVQASSGSGWDKGKRMSSDASVKSAKVCWSVVRKHISKTWLKDCCDNLTHSKLCRFLDFPRVECSQAKLSGTSPAANEEAVGCDSRSHPCEQLFHCKFSGISRKNRLWQPLENAEFWKVVKRWKVRHCWTHSLNI